jgi:transcriptional regulator with XRE-family HTH domain
MSALQEDTSWIKKGRELRHISQEALAQVLGVAVRTVSRWETGKAKPKQRDVESILYAFDAHDRGIAKAKELGDKLMLVAATQGVIWLLRNGKTLSGLGFTPEQIAAVSR